MNREVIVSCAVTGAGDTVDKHPAIPVTPEQIANAAIEAAQAGAAIAHMHVREPDGTPSRELAFYSEVVERVRDSDTDVIINLTAGMGGDFVPDEDDPSRGGPGTDMVGPLERLEHVEALLPEICSAGLRHAQLRCRRLHLDARVCCAPWRQAHPRSSASSPSWSASTRATCASPISWSRKAWSTTRRSIRSAWAFPGARRPTTAAMKTMADMLPEGAQWAGFGISAMEMPMVAQAVLLGGHVRVGLEDNLYLERGVFASNGQLVEKAVKIIEMMGARAVTPAEAPREAQAAGAKLAGLSISSV